MGFIHVFVCAYVCVCECVCFCKFVCVCVCVCVYECVIRAWGRRHGDSFMFMCVCMCACVLRTTALACIRRTSTRFQKSPMFKTRLDFRPGKVIWVEVEPHKTFTIFWNFVIIQMHICWNPRTHDLPTLRIHWAVYAKNQANAYLNPAICANSLTPSLFAGLLSW